MRDALALPLRQLKELRTKVTKESIKDFLLSIPRTPFNVFSAVILALGCLVTLLRFTAGLGFVTNLDDNTPWGVWNPFKIAGVALSACGYCACAAYYIFGLKHYKAVVRPAITCAFLGYLIAMVGMLHYDVGQPWRLVFPIVISQGTTSILFEVGVCVFLYLCVLFAEWTPAAFEWLGWDKIRAFVIKITLPMTIFGIILSTMHQSSLGALILTSPGKLHPLWYSAYIPVFFFISSMFAGLSMVVVEGVLSSRWQRNATDEAYLNSLDGVALSSARGCSLIMIGYLCIRVFDLAMSNSWAYFSTGYGALCLLELIGFVLAPAILYAAGAREKRIGLIKLAAFWTVAGVILNRFIIYLFALNWQLPPDERYSPSAMEIILLLFIVVLIITVYRVICWLMPVLRGHSGYADH
ncbi:polysulfide reductase NrfD [Desulfovibrio sp. OttesenSCG-928-O18]|nr:polysulfide reductase NrfD [Desulfovibrio sp. OttesenSCG-928-O18]